MLLHLKYSCNGLIFSLQIQFSSCMLTPFLQLLLQVLVQKSHDILQDEICSSIYSMAAVNFTAYHQQFLPKFLTSIGGLSEEQQQQLVANYKMVEVKYIIILLLKKWVIVPSLRGREINTAWLDSVGMNSLE